MDSDHHNDNSDGDDGDHALLAIGAVIRAALDAGVDPYAVAGVATEGATYAVARHVPLPEQANAAAALVLLVRDRLAAKGLGLDRLAGAIGSDDKPTLKPH